MIQRGKPLPGVPTPMHHWASDGGLHLAGDSWGPPNGQLVLLLHGGGQTRHAWGGTGRLLGAAGYRAVSFDARGHGDSDWAPDGRYDQDVMVRDLRSVVAALGGDCPVLVGASMGGGTSLVAVGEGHVDAGALILVDVAPLIEAHGVARIHAFMKQNADGFESLQEVADAIGRYQPQRKRPRSLDGLSKNVRLGHDGRYHWHWDPRFLDAPRDLVRRRERLSACAQRLRLPTLLVRGGTSDVVSEEGVRDFLALYPQAEYVNVSQAGHMVAGDRNDVFGQSAIEFLARTLTPMGSRMQRPGEAVAHVAAPGQSITDVP